MQTCAPFVSSVEAAFIAEVSDRDVNRVIDEQIVPDSLIHAGPGRRLARLAAPFIAFYFGTEAIFSAQLRKRILATITARIHATGRWERALTLTLPASRTDETKRFFTFSLEEPAPLIVDISRYVEHASMRARMVDDALGQISTDDETLGGMPVFKGTRVPIEIVLGSLDAGIDFAIVRDSYPFLTPALVEAARIYAMVRPRRGRPRRIDEAHPDWELKTSKVVRRSTTAS